MGKSLVAIAVAVLVTVVATASSNPSSIVPIVTLAAGLAWGLGLLRFPGVLAIADLALAVMLGIIAVASLRSAPSILCVIGAVVVLACWDIDRFDRNLNAAPANEHESALWCRHLQVLAVVLAAPTVVGVVATNVRFGLRWPVIVVLAAIAVTLMLRVDRGLQRDET